MVIDRAFEISSTNLYKIIIKFARNGNIRSEYAFLKHSNNLFSTMHEKERKKIDEFIEPG